MASGIILQRSMPFYVIKPLDLDSCPVSGLVSNHNQFQIVPSTLSWPPLTGEEPYSHGFGTFPRADKWSIEERTCQNCAGSGYISTQPDNVQLNYTGQQSPTEERMLKASQFDPLGRSQNEPFCRLLVNARHVVPGQRINAYLLVDQSKLRMHLLERLELKMKTREAGHELRLLKTILKHLAQRKKELGEERFKRVLVSRVRKYDSFSDLNGLTKSDIEAPDQSIFFVVRQTICYFDRNKKLTCREERDVYAGKMMLHSIYSGIHSEALDNLLVGARSLPKFGINKVTLAHSCRVPPLTPSNGNEFCSISNSYQLGVALRNKKLCNKLRCLQTIDKNNLELFHFNSPEDPEKAICDDLIYSVPLVVGTKPRSETLTALDSYRYLPGYMYSVYVTQWNCYKDEMNQDNERDDGERHTSWSSPLMVLPCYFLPNPDTKDSDISDTPEKTQIHRPIRLRTKVIEADYVNSTECLDKESIENNIARISRNVTSNKRSVSVYNKRGHEARYPYPKEEERVKKASEMIAKNLNIKHFPKNGKGLDEPLSDPFDDNFPIHKRIYVSEYDHDI
ncbi:hypothetical protein Ciccas_002319 [Cichlidogyrus casuarinus]|uniref:Uncharacterized protein n=1 Tax=Cichlidogyrus casuarinus TaxID=1844966 RepID=A0ABD2QHL6_9PLAT